MSSEERGQSRSQHLNPPRTYRDADKGYRGGDGLLFGGERNHPALRMSETTLERERDILKAGPLLWSLWGWGVADALA